MHARLNRLDCSAVPKTRFPKNSIGREIAGHRLCSSAVEKEKSICFSSSICVFRCTAVSLTIFAGEIGLSRDTYCYLLFVFHDLCILIRIVFVVVTWLIFATIS